MQTIIKLLYEACYLYERASYQLHSGHFDSTLCGGLGCPECIRAKELRNKADTIINKVNELLRNAPIISL